MKRAPEEEAACAGLMAALFIFVFFQLFYGAWRILDSLPQINIQITPHERGINP